MSCGPDPNRVTGPPSFVVEADAANLRARLTHILEYMTDGFLVIGRDWRIVHVNRAAARLLQQPAPRLIGRDIWEAFPEAVGSRFHAEYQRVLDTGEPACFDAEYVPLDVRFSVRAHPCAEGVEVYFLDIKEQVLAREHIREQAALLDQARDAIFVRTLDNVVTYWNHAAARLYGWTAEEIVGGTTLGRINPEGAQLDVINAALREHGVWSGDITQVTRSGATLVVNCSHTLVRDADGQPHRVLCINTDATQQRRAQAGLMRAQRMESLSTLAGGFAHELNNTLAPIVMGLDALKDEPCAAELGDVLDVAMQSTRRAAEMVGQVLAFSQGIAGEHELLDLRRIVTGVASMMRDTLPRSMSVTTSIPPHLWRVVGDAGQCRQALVNLCLNARDAMPDGGQLRLAVENALLDAEEAAAVDGLSAGPYVRIEVTDTGTGMPASVVARIFEPFYSTHGLGDRAGLGLAMVDTIVRSHRGGIRVASEVGSGSTFFIYLPADPS